MWAYLSGYVEVRVTGDRVERFINLAVERELDLWDLRFSRGTVRLKLTVRSFFRIRPIARATRSRVRILRKRGLPFFLRRAGRRKALVAGALASLALLYAASSFVWFVEVTGTEDLDPRQVAQKAAQLGLRPGAFKGAVDPDAVARGLMLELERVFWAAVNLQGTLAVIEVVERKVPPAEWLLREPVDVVAAHEGFLERLIVLRGERAVRDGRLVRRGDVLVRTNDDLPARAIAWARVWRQVTVEVPLVREHGRRTGRAWHTVHLRLGNSRLRLAPGLREEPPFARWETAETYRLFLPSFAGLPELEIRRATYYELERVQEADSPAEARARALGTAEGLLRREVPPGAEVVNRTVQLLRSPEGGYPGVLLRLIWETREDIAAPGGSAGTVAPPAGRESRPPGLDQRDPG